MHSQKKEIETVPKPDDCLFEHDTLSTKHSAPNHEGTTKNPKWQTYVLLHAILALYSIGGICSKMAAGEPFASLPFFAWYAAVLAILFIYALVWQQILRRLPLTTAFANKGITMIWGMLWGALIFAEQISIWMLIGAVIVFLGVLLVVTDIE